jgi:hypothetical protein
LKCKNTYQKIDNMYDFQKQLQQSKPEFEADISSNELWEEIKKWLIEASKENKTKHPIKHKHWLSDPTLKLIENRRQIARRGIHTTE